MTANAKEPKSAASNPEQLAVAEMPSCQPYAGNENLSGTNIDAERCLDASSKKRSVLAPQLGEKTMIGRFGLALIATLAAASIGPALAQTSGGNSGGSDYKAAPNNASGNSGGSDYKAGKNNAGGNSGGSDYKAAPNNSAGNSGGSDYKAGNNQGK